MTIVLSIWWLLFWTAVGLCVGSFLNAVIYRLPRHGSIRKPTWSACPLCGHRIRWYDNLPILSFILLRGRCRRCGLPIATRYIVIEAAMAVVVLMLLDAFFIAHVRQGLHSGVFGINDDLAYDWPIFVAHIVLFACLFCMSAIDLEHYWVDVRFTNFAVIVGFVCHVLWTPKHSAAWPRPSDVTAAASLFALVGLGIVWIVLACRPYADPEDFGETEPASEAGPAPENAVETASSARLRSFDPPSRVFGWISAFILLALLAELVLLVLGTTSIRHEPRGLIPLGLFFALILSEMAVARESDQEIIAAIEQERFSARRVALVEFGLLVPAVLLAAAALTAMFQSPELAERIESALKLRVPIHKPDFLRSWTPLQGLATATTGYVLAGALGWVIRIIFTLVLGKEAFGVGDIHLMAAAGCIAGWPVAVLGFFLACGLALAGWIIALPFKRARALPLGPWLSLAFLSVVIFYEPLVQSTVVRNLVTVVQWAAH